jgi:hypothetical protein
MQSSSLLQHDVYVAGRVLRDRRCKQLQTNLLQVDEQKADICASVRVISFLEVSDLNTN